MFRSLLIANRGEIALRIARSCRELGVKTVGVFSEVDRGAPWLESMDASICLGPSRADGSYLDGDAVLQAALQMRCQALHPGYGFLAENARFAARCAASGVTFVGPGAGAIGRMGDKVEAKRTLAAAGIPTIPGSAGALCDADEARRLAGVFGYPVLLKARAGGGGKGMRRCADEAELRVGFEQATLEAAKAFGDGSLYLEKFIEGGRHVEFQVLADAFGAAVHLGERDCSVQRHHQKLVEESPSPVVGIAERDELGGRVARAVGQSGYRSAGTVEFLRAPDGSFYFMELNARLQVEHPVTELCTGIDLVAEQLRIAANQPLRWSQAEITHQGHAIEFRINAEDPDQGFRPDPGEITAFVPPPERIGAARVRWDSFVRSGYRVPPWYDSMIGKLIVHAPTRAEAIEAAAGALAQLEVGGVRTTLPLHRRIVTTPAFCDGSYDLNFLRHDLENG